VIGRGGGVRHERGGAPDAVRRIIGYVPQLLSADATLTGWENVQLFARLAK
jgi:ABC-type multidrug transport system ATPase subunit